MGPLYRPLTRHHRLAHKMSNDRSGYGFESCCAAGPIQSPISQPIAIGLGYRLERDRKPLLLKIPQLES